MHISFTAHNSNSSTSSSSLIEYLDKENHLQNERGEGLTIENYFNSDYDSINSNQEINSQEIINNLDSNRGSQKLASSNFYMLNVSPSKFELEHMEKIAEAELKNRGLEENNNKASQLLYKEQKEELIKMQLKLYTKDVMTNYAQNFNREIYVNEDKLPNDAEKSVINKETEKQFNDFLKEKNIIIPNEKLNQEVRSKEWVVVNNASVLSQTDKSYSVELEINGKGKAVVFVPKAALQIQKDGSIKMPKNLIEEKEKEVISKNNLIPNNFQYVNSKPVTINNTKTNVITFEKTDSRFSEKLTYSVDEKDLIKKGNTYLISEHLLKEKEAYAIKAAIEKEYGKEREVLYNKIAQEKGFDMTKRPLTEKDLMWYAKVETSRTFKRTDKWVQENVKLEKQIKELQSKKLFKDHAKIETLNKQLHRDSKGEVIKAGDKKEGNQHHVHIVVSRHDKTMKSPRNKISLSPLSNAKDSSMKNGAKVGFDRNAFFEKAEKIFDEKFSFDRSKAQTYENYKNQASKSNIVESKAKSSTKQFVYKHSGITEAKAKINPIQDIKRELGIAKIPSKLPKGLTDLAFKVSKKILSKGIEIN